MGFVQSMAAGACEAPSRVKSTLAPTRAPRWHWELLPFMRPAQGWALVGLLVLTGVIVAGAAFLSTKGGRPVTVELERGSVLIARDKNYRGKPFASRLVGPRNQANIEPLLAKIAQGPGLTLSAWLTSLEIIAGQNGDMIAQLCFQRLQRLVSFFGGMNRRGSQRQGRNQQRRSLGGYRKQAPVHPASLKHK